MNGKAARGSPRSCRAGALSKVIARWCAHAKLTRAFGTVDCTVQLESLVKHAAPCEKCDRLPVSAKDEASQLAPEVPFAIVSANESHVCRESCVTLIGCSSSVQEQLAFIMR